MRFYHDWIQHCALTCEDSNIVTMLVICFCLLTAASRFVGLSFVQNLFLGVELSLVQNLFLKHDPFRDRRSRGGAAECLS